MKNLLIAVLMLPLMVACGAPAVDEEALAAERKKAANCQSEVRDFRKYDLFIYSRTGEMVRLTRSTHSCTRGGAQVVVKFDNGNTTYVYASELTRAKIPE